MANLLTNIRTRIRQAVCRHRERTVEVVSSGDANAWEQYLLRRHTCKRCGKIVEYTKETIPNANF